MEQLEQPVIRPKFVPQAEQFVDAARFAAVDDGWLVGFNEGEFGAALYWFSGDGRRSYKISEHQVVDFVRLSDGVYAIEGLAHLTLSRGSMIRITKPRADDRWAAAEVTKFPGKPYTVSVRRDETMLITLDGSLIAIGRDRKVETLLADFPAGGLYPSSSVLSRDERKLYVGMRQFVAEFELETETLRLLIPSEAFLNRLTPEDERQILKVLGDIQSVKTQRQR
jgi:hypothetical protein